MQEGLAEEAADGDRDTDTDRLADALEAVKLWVEVVERDRERVAERECVGVVVRDPEGVAVVERDGGDRVAVRVAAGDGDGDRVGLQVRVEAVAEGVAVGERDADGRDREKEPVADPLRDPVRESDPVRDAVVVGRTVTDAVAEEVKLGVREAERLLERVPGVRDAVDTETDGLVLVVWE